MKTTLNGIGIDVRSESSLYITIGDKVIYIDDSTEDLIIDSWNKDEQIEVRSMDNISCIYATSGLVYSRKEARKLFKDCVLPENLPMLLDHICIDSLAQYIQAFFEDEGVLMLDLGGEYLAVKRNNKKSA